MTIGEKIKALRKVRHMTQKELAEKCGMFDSAVRKYESGRLNPKRERLHKFANALNIPTALFDIDDVSFQQALDSGVDEFCDMMFAHDEAFLYGTAQCEPPAYFGTSHDIDDDELDYIKKYRSLDDYGKKVIDSILSIEHERCSAIQPEQDKPEIISIKFAYLPASAGLGIDLSEENYKMLDVRATALTRSADFAVKVSGDSMEPTYSDGDILLVENMPISKGDIGIFILNGDGYVKEFGGDRLISHNSKYPDIKLSEHDVIMCPGRVIGKLDDDDYIF